MGGGKGGGSSGPSAYDISKQSYHDQEMRKRWEVDQNIADATSFANKTVLNINEIRKEYKDERKDFIDQKQDLWDESRRTFDIEQELESRSGMDVFKSKNLFKGGVPKGYFGTDEKAARHTIANKNNNVDSTYSDWYNEVKTKDPSLFDEISYDTQEATYDWGKYDTLEGSGAVHSIDTAHGLASYNAVRDRRLDGLDKWIDTSANYLKSVQEGYSGKEAKERENLGEFDTLTQKWKDVSKGYKSDTVGEVGRNLTFAKRGGAESSQTSKNLTKIAKDSAIGKKHSSIGYAKSKTLGDDEKDSSLG